MAEENKETNSLDDLSKLKVDDKEEAIINEPKIDTLGRSYATGRRKESTARVWVKRGTGKISINGKEMVNYFARPVLQMQLNFVFDVAERKDQFDGNRIHLGMEKDARYGTTIHIYENNTRIVPNSCF